VPRVEARIRTKAKGDRDPEKRELKDGVVAGMARDYLYRHLYDARTIPVLANWSSCPPMPFLFEKREITGQRSDAALDVPVEDGWEIVPTDRADSLVSYLLSLHHNDAVPASMDYAPAAPAAGSQG
jgi:cytochrome c oxidase cbb3-type subunit 2